MKKLGLQFMSSGFKCHVLLTGLQHDQKLYLSQKEDTSSVSVPLLSCLSQCGRSYLCLQTAYCRWEQLFILQWGLIKALGSQLSWQTYMWQLYLSHGSFLLRNVLVCNWAQGMLDRNNLGRYKSLGWSRERDKNSFSSIPDLILSAFLCHFERAFCTMKCGWKVRMWEKVRTNYGKPVGNICLLSRETKPFQPPKILGQREWCPFALFFFCLSIVGSSAYLQCSPTAL